MPIQPADTRWKTASNARFDVEHKGNRTTILFEKALDAEPSSDRQPMRSSHSTTKHIARGKTP